MSILQQISKTLEEAQKSLHQCKLDQIECNLELEKKAEKVLELEQRISQFEEKMNKRSYAIHKEKIFEKIKSEKSNIILQYDYYDLSIVTFIYNTSRPIFKKPTIMKYLIDNIDLDSKNEDGFKFIHFLCRSSTLDIIQYAIEKGANLEDATNFGLKPIHFICANHNEKVIRYFIDKGVDLECATEDLWRPIHYLCEFGPLTIVDDMMKKVDITCTTKKGDTVASLLLKRALGKK